MDGDGRADRAIVEESRGSGGGGTTVTISLSSGVRLSAEVERSFTALVTRTAIPRELLAGGRECALALTERLAFGKLQGDVDPSLDWLLSDSKVLRWIDGPPQLPGSYTVRIGDEWVSYLGATHGQQLGKAAPAREVAREGERVLVATSHGVILTDPSRTRHAWLYVSQGNERKLRWPSIREARFEAELAVIGLEPFTPGDPPEIVRVELATGRLLP